jgi:riboflavin synthase
MFTGLIESVGRVGRIEPSAAGHRLAVATELSRELTLGESLAVNGVCLTVVQAGDGIIQADVSPETARITSLGRLGVGSLVNLERSLRADARIGGHFVQGHVDGTARIVAIDEAGDARKVSLTLPVGLEGYVVEKGSIALDGISLTVAAVAGRSIDVHIIPFTWQHTNLRAVRAGMVVNVECDILGKYVAKALAARHG